MNVSRTGVRGPEDRTPCDQSGRPGSEGPVLVAVGFRAEARLLPLSPDLRLICAGSDTMRLALALRRAAADGARGILSLGIAGGLEPALRPGALVVATSVRVPGEAPLPANTGWAVAIARACADAGLPARLGPLAGTGAVVADPVAKQALREATGALAADLESAPAARLALDLGIPFAALRAVADPADEELPQAAILGLTPEGNPDLPRVLRALLHRPGDLPSLVRAARRTATALRVLARVGRGAAGWWLPPGGRD